MSSLNVLASFLRGEHAGRLSLSTDGVRLWSGVTCIAERRGDAVREVEGSGTEPDRVRRHRRELRDMLALIGRTAAGG